MSRPVSRREAGANILIGGAGTVIELGVAIFLAKHTPLMWLPLATAALLFGYTLFWGARYDRASE